MTSSQTDSVIHEILSERNRQIEEEGWTPEHDDEHTDGQLAGAAGCYLLFSDAYPNEGEPPPEWPFEARWWKPKDYRRDCIRAVTMAVAEVERLDRLEPPCER